MSCHDPGWQYHALYLNQVKSVVAVDEHTVQIETDGPAPVLLANLAMIPILSQRLAQQKGLTELGQAPLDHRKTLAGTGPYQLDHWHKGTELVLTRNPYYWADEPPWSQVIFRPIPDGHKRVEALVTGVVDIIEAPPVAGQARRKPSEQGSIATGKEQYDLCKLYTPSSYPFVDSLSPILSDFSNKMYKDNGKKITSIRCTRLYNIIR